MFFLPSISSRTYKSLIFQDLYYINSFDLYLVCIYIYNHIWWGWQGGATGNYESKDRGLIPNGNIQYYTTIIQK